MTQEHPLALSADLLTREVAGELIVFDVERRQAHVLDAQAVVVWRACDGHRSVSQLAQDCGLEEEVVEYVLARLESCTLLASPRSQDTLDPGMAESNDLSRRAMLRRAAVAGAGIGVVLPVIRSIAVPSAADAASSTPRIIPPLTPQTPVPPGGPPVLPPGGQGGQLGSTTQSRPPVTHHATKAKKHKKKKKKHKKHKLRRRRHVTPHFTG